MDVLQALQIQHGLFIISLIPDPIRSKLMPLLIPQAETMTCSHLSSLLIIKIFTKILYFALPPKRLQVFLLLSILEIKAHFRSLSPLIWTVKMVLF